MKWYKPQLDINILSLLKSLTLNSKYMILLANGAIVIPKKVPRQNDKKASHALIYKFSY